MPDECPKDLPEVPKSPRLNARGEPWRTGDVFLDRYMPHATHTEREEARENLRRFSRLVLRICTRIADEEYEKRQSEASAAIERAADGPSNSPSGRSW
jgi:hypothetical protein